MSIYETSDDWTKATTPPRHLYQNCPLCKGDASQIIVADCAKHPLYQPILPPRIYWQQCETCKHVYTSGYWTDEALKIIFCKTHDNQRPGSDMELGRAVSAEIVEKVARPLGRLPTSNDIWMDVGFGNGALMFTAAEFGFKPVGLDLRPDTVAMMQGIGLEVHCCDINSYAVQSEHISVISMADCLEHMPFPKQGLEAAHKLLRPDGILFLSMPNMGAPMWSFLDQAGKNPYWGEIEHYHNFSRERLYALLEETGFTPVSYGISKRYICCMEVMARQA